MPSEFVHLHVHTEYSLLDGQSRINALMERAQELDMPAVGISDHGVMFGVIDFYRAAKKAGIKPVLGMEAYLAPRTRFDKDAEDKRPYHMLLFAQNDIGYKNLMKLASKAQLEGYYYRPRIDREIMAEYSEGIIATSGCLAAEIPRLVEDGKDEDAREKIGWYLDVFGEDNFYLELQPHKIDNLEVLNQWLIDYRKSNHTNVQFYASNDVHYVYQADADVHDTLLCIQTGAHKSEQNRMRMNPQDSYYMKSDAEMRTEFLKHGMPEAMIHEAFANSLKIADMTHVNLDDTKYHLPIFPVPLEFNDDSGAYLHYLCEMGLLWRYPGRENDPVLQDRLNYELEVVSGMGFNTYFLIVWDLCEYAREVDIWWNVRGSGAGSLVAYSLGITNIDPIQNSLLFERFLNPGRVSMPDIDLDYPDDRRAEMIAYAVNKYGKDKVAAIITFGTMGAKASVKDVGRALDVDLAKVNNATRLIPQEARQKKIAEYIELNPELQDLYNKDSDIKKVMDAAIQLQGMTRHASTHAAGIIISDKPLEEYTPLHRITGTDPSGGSLEAVTQFPMETAESIGLLKVDFLGLSTLTILRKACDLINKHHGTSYSMDNIPYRHDDLTHPLSEDDAQHLNQAFEMMGRGETVGVFQVESGGMQSMLRGMRPQRFQHVVAGISLYRPGPMDFIPAYNRRLHGEEEIPYKHPKLKSILEETFSIIVYQEQIMQIASELFGYKLGEADLMRKAVSKKKAADLARHKEIFITRGPQNDVPEDVAESIFDEIEFFANYGFNKSHASDYAVITVQTAFLKCHYPAEYMTALLSVQFDNSDKVALFLEECRRLEIPVLPPHVNYSDVDFDIEVTEDAKRGIRFGMGAIKNAGISALQHIIDERRANGQFTSLVDFCHRVDLSQVGKRAIESLIKVGALGDWGKRDALHDALDRIIGFSADYHKAKHDGQMSLFGEMSGIEETLHIPELPPKKKVAHREQLAWEKDLMGLYVSGRPVDRHIKRFRAMSNLSIITELKDPEKSPKQGEQVKIAGEIVGLRKVTTKKNDQMAIMSLEDWHESAGIIEVVLFPRTWDEARVYVEQYKRERAEDNDETITEDNRFELEEGDILVVNGKYDNSRDVQILGDKISFEFEAMTPDEIVSTLNHSNAVPPWMNGQGSEDEPPPYLGYDEETGEMLQNEAPPPIPISNVAPATMGGSVPVPSLEPRFGANHEEQPAWANGNGHHIKDNTLFVDFETAQNGGRASVHISVHFARSNDPNRDRRRLRRIHTALVGYPGQDSFSIVIEAGNKTSIMDFPNHTTGLCNTLRRDLESIVGRENIYIEEKG